MSISEDYIRSTISEVAANLKLDGWRYHVTKFKNIGQNYFGVIIPVSLSGSRMSENVAFTRYNIVLKLAPTDEKYRVSGAVTKFFNKEIFVYTVLMKQYEKIQFQITMFPKFLIPSVYFVRNEYCKEVIAMQEMSRFIPYTHKQFLDLGHITIALESLARLHALSFILEKEDSKIYREVITNCEPLTESSNKRFIYIMKDRLCKAISKFKDTQHELLLQSFLQNCGIFFDKAVELAKVTCICHGDIWKENILFYYDEDNKPTKACIIDYQTVRLSSPAFDTLYLIITSTDKKLRQEHYYKLLDVYYNTFSHNITCYNESLNGVYSREELDHDLKVVAPACLITANTAMWLSNGLQEEGHVRSKQILNTSEEKDSAVLKYKSIVSGIIDDFYSYGYLPYDII